MKVRPATRHDRYAIARVHDAAIRSVTTCSPEQIESWAAHITPEAYLPYLATRDFVVALDDRKVVGFAELNREDAEVGAVYVDPGRQRRGVGRLLLDEIERIARDAGIVQLHVVASLNAVPFYVASGFVTREESTILTRGGVAIPCAVMTKSLIP